MRAMQRLLAWCLIVAAGGISGCGKPGRHALSGRITYQGKPVPVGDIRFEPDTSQGNDGPGVRLDFTDGHYRTTSDMGVVTGPHKVFIRGFDGKGKPATSAGPAPYVGFPLFPEYMTTIDLPSQQRVLDIEVPATSGNPN